MEVTILPLQKNHFCVKYRCSVQGAPLTLTGAFFISSCRYEEPPRAEVGLTASGGRRFVQDQPVHTKFAYGYCKLSEVHRFAHVGICSPLITCDQVLLFIG